VTRRIDDWSGTLGAKVVVAVVGVAVVGVEVEGVLLVLTAGLSIAVALGLERVLVLIVFRAVGPLTDTDGDVGCSEWETGE